MEIVIALAGFVVIVIVIRATSTPRSDEAPRDTAPLHTPGKPRPYPERTATPAPRRTPSVPRPFSPETAAPAPRQTTLSGKAYVVDGDTIVIRKTQIRLFGVDAPELNHPYGKKAKWALHELCKGQTVHAMILETDAHGRTVAKCLLADGRDLSAEMVKAGLAIDWKKFSGGVYQQFEPADARKKMWLADARQKGRMHVWAKFESQRGDRSN